MLIKLLGGILIFSGCTIWGFLKSENLKKREQSLINIKTALTLLEGEIIFSTHHLKYAFQRISKLTECGDIFLNAAQKIGEMSAGEAWNTAILYNQKQLALTSEDCDILNILSSGLGTSDREQQIKNIRHVSSLLENAIKDASEDYKKSAKLYQSMGILGGLFITILLL